MNSSGISGAQQSSTDSARYVGASMPWCRRSPSARLPTRSWFCRKNVNACGSSPAGSLPRGPWWYPECCSGEQPSLAQRGGEIGGAAAIVGVEAVVVAGHQATDLVVEVVGPGAGVAPSAVRPRPREDRVVAVILGDQHHVVPGPGADALGELLEERMGRLVDNGVRGIEPQPVDVILVDPVEGVVDEEVAHLALAGAIEVQRRPPRRAVHRREDRRRERGEVRAIGAKVVVDDVEQHRQAEAVRGVDERAQVVGSSIAARGGEQRRAVVSPVPSPWELRHRHQLDCGDAEPAEVREPAGHPGKGPLGRERADVQFIDGECRRRRRRPVLVGPPEGGRVDDLGAAVYAVRLGARRRIRKRPLVVEQEPVAIAGPRPGNGVLEHPVRAGREDEAARRGVVALEQELDEAPPRGPDARVHGVVLDPRPEAGPPGAADVGGRGGRQLVRHAGRRRARGAGASR